MRTHALVLVIVVVGCRVRSRYDGAATGACMAKAYAVDDAVRIDGGTMPRTGEGSVDELCRKCCRDRGLSDVEPGHCSCGDRGLDAILK